MMTPDPANMIQSPSFSLHPTENYRMSEDACTDMETDKLADFSWQPSLSTGSGSSSILTVTAEVDSDPLRLLTEKEPEESVQQLLQAISLEDEPCDRKNTWRGRSRKRKFRVVRRDSSVSDNEVIYSEPPVTRRTRSEEPKTASKSEISGDPKNLKALMRLRSTKSFKTRSKNINLLNIGRIVPEAFEPKPKRLKT